MNTDEFNTSAIKRGINTLYSLFQHLFNLVFGAISRTHLTGILPLCFVSLSMLQTCMAFRGIKVLCDIFYIEKYFREMNVRFYVGLSAFSSNFSQYIFFLLNQENLR